jgi:hypothetical protein
MYSYTHRRTLVASHACIELAALLQLLSSGSCVYALLNVNTGVTTLCLLQAKELASAVTAGLRSKYNAKQRAVAIAQNGISTPDASISSIVNSDITNGVNVYPVYTGILHILANDGLWTDAIKIIEVSTASVTMSSLVICNIC